VAEAKLGIMGIGWNLNHLATSKTGGLEQYEAQQAAAALKQARPDIAISNYRYHYEDCHYYDHLYDHNHHDHNCYHHNHHINNYPDDTHNHDVGYKCHYNDTNNINNNTVIVNIIFSNTARRLLWLYVQGTHQFFQQAQVHCSPAV
jgi:hypothetical protein